MKTRASHITATSIRAFMILFWAWVALDKLWDLPGFHQALIKQPFPDWWAGILFWLLPLMELAIVLLFSIHSFRKKKHLFFDPFALSALLLTVFTVYIVLGVAGLYAQKPCGCASVLSGLSWGGHLVVNLLLLLLSILGWYLTGPTTPMAGCKRSKKQVILFYTRRLLINVPIYAVILLRVKKYKMRFALFPAGPVEL
ncbi:MauE/DoxX family redox-associated membrane protein [Sphingobacterium thalpophilum]|uniref:MauE/DoxX family redox-associated membrane protein n=1 Tax=Sphingobacterium thalpophilum TaxID=259 RepID=A0ACD5C6L7_9SPHI|nr:MULTISPECIES: MauE/DoxX family redox-associated membrane protein [Sphingobacterium]